MPIFRRHARQSIPHPPDVNGPAGTESPHRLAVLLSPGLADLSDPLSEALGCDFAVQTDDLGGHGLMIVGPVGPTGVRFLKVSHPGVVLLVVDRRSSGRCPTEAVSHLEAGADGYLANPAVAEVASHIRALARRAPANAAATTRSPATAA